jgi:hypothetical protein
MVDFTLLAAADRLGVHYMTMHRYVRLGHDVEGGRPPARVGSRSRRIRTSPLRSARGGEAPWAERLAPGCRRVGSAWPDIAMKMNADGTPKQIAPRPAQESVWSHARPTAPDPSGRRVLEAADCGRVVMP